MRRAAAILALTLLLGGCNIVTSPTPLFTEADTVGGASLRPGVWLAVDPKCRFDASAPLTSWPDCAGAVTVDREGRLFLDEKEPASIVLTGGDPMVLQVGAKEDQGGGYSFYGVRPTRTRWDGRVVALSVWFVTCGPSPPDDAKNADGSKRFATLEPAPGLVVEGNNCVAHDRAAVRAAVVASEKDGVLRYKWVRARP